MKEFSPFFHCIRDLTIWFHKFFPVNKTESRTPEEINIAKSGYVSHTIMLIVNFQPPSLKRSMILIIYRQLQAREHTPRSSVILENVISAQLVSYHATLQPAPDVPGFPRAASSLVFSLRRFVPQFEHFNRPTLCCRRTLQACLKSTLNLIERPANFLVIRNHINC